MRPIFTRTFTKSCRVYILFWLVKVISVRCLKCGLWDWNSNSIRIQEPVISTKNLGKILISANIYLFKVDNRNTRKWCYISSELTMKTLERRHDVVLVF